MLVLARKINEQIMIGDEVRVSVVDIRGDQVKIGISAPSTVKVYRLEVYEAIQRENVQAASGAPATLPDLLSARPPRSPGTNREEGASPSDAGPDRGRTSNKTDNAADGSASTPKR